MGSVRSWSYSTLSAFLTCPEQYRRKHVTRDIVDPPTEAKEWGIVAHKAFEDRLTDGLVLPPSLEEHEDYCRKIEAYAGEGRVQCELKGALDRNQQPVEVATEGDWIRNRSIWARMVLDVFKLVRGGTAALVCDFKTGKEKPEYKRQLKLFAMYVWQRYPEVDLVDTRLYYLPTKNEVREVYGRAQKAELWNSFVPDLQRWKHAHRFDQWDRKKSGLCAGWCPVTDCPNWSPKRPKRS